MRGPGRPPIGSTVIATMIIVLRAELQKCQRSRPAVMDDAASAFIITLGQRHKLRESSSEVVTFSIRDSTLTQCHPERTGVLIARGVRATGWRSEGPVHFARTIRTLRYVPRPGPGLSHIAVTQPPPPPSPPRPRWPRDAAASPSPLAHTSRGLGLRPIPARSSSNVRRFPSPERR